VKTLAVRSDLAVFIDLILLDLMQACLSRLLAQHLPKKEARRGWRFWRRGEAVKTDRSSAAVSATIKV